MFSAESPNSLRRSTAGPECPNTSFTPTLITGTGQHSVTASATAEPRPPMILCSSAVTITPVSFAHLQTSSLSRRLYRVDIYYSCGNTLGCKYFCRLESLVYPMRPVATIVTSLPSRRTIPLPSSNLYVAESLITGTARRPKRI